MALVHLGFNSNLMLANKYLISYSLFVKYSFVTEIVLFKYHQITHFI